MLRLPLPEAGITAACNFTIASALLNVISGASVTLYGPKSKGKRGQLFRETAEHFYPWELEPAKGISNSKTGAALFYNTFRNPLTHELGRHDSPGPVFVRRFRAFTESDIEELETARVRPPGLFNAPTLEQRPDAHADLHVESLYWGVRQLLRRLTDDGDRMAIAERHLQ